MKDDKVSVLEVNAELPGVFKVPAYKVYATPGTSTDLVYTFKLLQSSGGQITFSQVFKLSI